MQPAIMAKLKVSVIIQSVSSERNNSYMKKFTSITPEQSLKSKAIVLKNRLLALEEQKFDERDAFKVLRKKGLITHSEDFKQQGLIYDRYGYIISEMRRDYLKAMRAYYRSKEYADDYLFHSQDYKISIKKINELLKKLKTVSESRTIIIKDYPTKGSLQKTGPKYFCQELCELKSAYLKSPKQYTVEDARVLERDPWMSGLNGVEMAEILIV